MLLFSIIIAYKALIPMRFWKDAVYFICCYNALRL